MNVFSGNTQNTKQSWKEENGEMVLVPKNDG
jgi:hypothetical protein